MNAGRCLLKDFGLRVDIQGHLSRIESRRRDLDACLCEASLPSALRSRLFSLPESVDWTSADQLWSALALSQEEEPGKPGKQEKLKEWRDGVERVVELLSTPRPPFQVDCCVGSLDLNVSKKQLDFLAKLFASSSSSLSSSDSTSKSTNDSTKDSTNSLSNDSISNSSNNPAVKTEESADPLPPSAEDLSPVYAFGVLPFALHLLNGLFSSRWLFFYVLGVLFSLPLLFFHPFYYLSMLLPLLIAIAADWIYLSRFYSFIGTDFASPSQTTALSPLSTRSLFPSRLCKPPCRWGKTSNRFTANWRAVRFSTAFHRERKVGSVCF